MRKWVFATLAAAVVLSSSVLFAEGTKKIQDNSFLLEEAYNQEAGVVQHIQTFQHMKDDTWSYSFTQEWPVPGQAHQLSYTIPVLHAVGPKTETGTGDILLNYRYQLVFKEKEGIAFAPRLSVLLPTGDYKKGFGGDAAGLQTNLPLSVEFSDKWVTHWNIGATYVQGSKEPGGKKADILGFNYGLSLIWLTTENVNFMIEMAGSSNETVQADGTTARNDSFIINPGARFAINFKSGLQIVPGIAFPTGIGPSSGQNGIFLYLSFEHPLF